VWLQEPFIAAVCEEQVAQLCRLPSFLLLTEKVTADNRVTSTSFV
jgi:hypothetical protein